MRIIHQRMQRIGRERGGVVAVELGERARRGRRRDACCAAKASASNSWRRASRLASGWNGNMKTGHHQREARERGADVRLGAGPAPAWKAGSRSSQPRSAEQQRARARSAPRAAAGCGRARSGRARARAPPRSPSGVRRSISVSKKTMRLVRAEAGEVRVAVARALRAVHHEEARRRGSRSARAAPRCALRSSPSSSGVKRLKSGAIQRGNATTSTQREGDPREPRVEPPERARVPRRARRPRAAAARRARRRAPAPLARSPRRSRGVVRLKPWRSSITKVRQRSKGSACERCSPASTPNTVARLAQRSPSPKRARGQRVDRGDAAAQREREQHHAVDARRVSTSAEALLVERVVGGLAVRLERDQRREVGRAPRSRWRATWRAWRRPRQSRQARAASDEGGEDGGEGGAFNASGGPEWRDTIAAADEIARFYGTGQDPAGLGRHGDVGARSRARAHPRGGDGGDRRGAERHRRGAGLRDPPARRGAGRHGLVEPLDPRQVRASSTRCAPRRSPRPRSRRILVEFLKPLVRRAHRPAVRQHRAPGPALHGALHAARSTPTCTTASSTCPR